MDDSKPEASAEHEDMMSFRYRDYAIEDYLALVLFWLLAVDVFAQFFSRYAMQSSIGWTEEMARYLLISVSFIGSSMAVRRNSHITVEMFYRYMPERFAMVMSHLLDIGRVLFCALLAFICWKVAQRTFGTMVSLPVPKQALYYAVFAGFVLMALRGLQVAVANFRSGRHAQLPRSSHSLLD